MMDNKIITRTELGWIVQALNHDIAALTDEMTRWDSDVARSVGRLVIEDRERLATRIADIMNSDIKRITIQ